MLTFTKRQGVANPSEVVQVMTESATGGFVPLAGVYTGAEALSCVLWPGDDRAVTATLPATWADGPNGKVRIAFPLDVMTGLEATWYTALLTLASDSTLLAELRIVVEAGPGTATAPKAYHSYKDLVDEMPYVAKLADQLNDQSGFIEVAAAARRWIDAAILRSVPDHGLIAAPGYGYGYWDGREYGFHGARGQAVNADVAAALDADKLDVTTAVGRRFVDASVYYTLSRVLRRAVGANANNDLRELSDEYARMAEKKLATCVAQIDVYGTGRVDVFPIARKRMRRM